MSASAKSGLVVVLPESPVVSGVTAWARRLSARLASRGRRCAIVLHGSGAFESPPGVLVRRVDPTSTIKVAGADLEEIACAYAAVVDEVHQGTGLPVVVSPNLLGDCYGAAAGLTRLAGDRVRLVGWAHSDNAYDEAVLRHYGECLHATVGVSRVLAERLHGVGRSGSRALAYGVEAPASCPPRPGVAEAGLRLLFAGRLEHGQKRVGALPHLVAGLDERGVRFELEICGCGDAEDELRSVFKGDARVQFSGRLSAEKTAERMRRAHAFVLCSRYEGLSVAMLESMGVGCVPVVTRVRSGAAEAVRDGETGVLVEASEDAEVSEVGVAMADRIAAVDAGAWAGMSRAAHRRAVSRYGMDAHGDAVESLIDAVCGMAPIRWPAELSLAYPSAGPGAADRLRGLLHELDGRRLAIHGVGRHTSELRSELESAVSVGLVVAFVDDRTSCGAALLGVPVVRPADVARLGVTDVVISSRMHEPAIWSRRSVYESIGVRVHRLYGDGGAPGSTMVSRERAVRLG